jgi:hypothetical protein
MLYFPPTSRQGAEKQVVSRKHEKKSNREKTKNFKVKEQKKEHKATRQKAREDAADARKKQIEQSGNWTMFYLNMRAFFLKDGTDTLTTATKAFKSYQTLLKRKKSLTFDRQTHHIAIDGKAIIKNIKKVAKETSEASATTEDGKRNSSAEHILKFLETEEFINAFLSEYENVIVAGTIMLPFPFGWGGSHVEMAGLKSSNFIEQKTTKLVGKKGIFGIQKFKYSFSYKFIKKTFASLANYGLNELVQAWMVPSVTSIKHNPDGDLLKTVASAVEKWWILRQMSRGPGAGPSVCFPPAIASPTDNVNMTLTIVPGFFPFIPVLPTSTVHGWLMTFIINANLHLLSVGGFYFCFHTTSVAGVPLGPMYPTPWIGYLTKPIAMPVLNPFSKPIGEMLKNPKELLAEIGDYISEEALAETLTQTAELASAIKEKGIVEGVKDRGKDIADKAVKLQTAIINGGFK